MSDNYFYIDTENESIQSSPFIKSLQQYALSEQRQIYAVSHPLDGNYTYQYNQAVIVLISDCQIAIVDFSQETDSREFDEYCEDIVEDMASLSDRYEYKEHLGRPRKWRSLIECCNVSDSRCKDASAFIDSITIDDNMQRRIANLLISLFLGSINDLSDLGVEVPADYLDAVKRKIILFDTDQSRFIYEPAPPRQKRVKIQGLAGTGKTEILLHKLRELYTRKSDARSRPKIAYTCFNKILAKKMKERIPAFFNSMKVQQQIEWDARLWVFSSWGSHADRNSGLYSFICHVYNLQFESFQVAHSLETACEHALEALSVRDDVEPCFDYLLVDEGQDFKEPFFELCEKVTRHTVYVAGDVFQNIFDISVDDQVGKNDYLLNRCYRTDYRTLMFAHALGMGLCEKPVIRWLQDSGWKNCGYEIRKTGESLTLSRPFVRDLLQGALVQEPDNEGIYITECDPQGIADEIIDVIKTIKSWYPTVEAGDIAVVFPNVGNRNYLLCDNLVGMIRTEFGWNAVKGYEAKDVSKDSVFISNKNNIKGLEFPFVICFFLGEISDDILLRNSLYMVLTRSFLSSFFVVDACNSNLIKKYKEIRSQIIKTGKMRVRIPDDQEIERQKANVEIVARKDRRSLEEIFSDVFSRHPELPIENRADVRDMFKIGSKDGGFIDGSLEESVEQMVVFYIKTFI